MRFAILGALAVASVAFAMPATAQFGTAAIGFDDQTSDGSVSIATVELPDDGFVVVTNETSGEMLGHSSLLTAGNHSNVTVMLDQQASGDMTLTATLHADTDGDGDFTQGNDTAYLGASDTATVTMQADQTDNDMLPGTQPAQPDQEDDAGEPETQTPGFEFVAILSVLAAAVLVARRR